MVNSPLTESTGYISHMAETAFSGNLQEDFAQSAFPVSNLADVLSFLGKKGLWTDISSSTISQVDLRSPDPRRDVRTTREVEEALLTADLGWTLQDSVETFARLRTFEEDWAAPGMEAYDEL